MRYKMQYGTQKQFCKSNNKEFDLKKHRLWCILPRCVLDLTTEVQNPTKQKI